MTRLLVPTEISLLVLGCFDGAMRNSHLPHDCSYCALIVECAIDSELFAQFVACLLLGVHT